MKTINKKKILQIIVFIFFISLAIISIKNYFPETEASEQKTIQVTYKSGDGIGEDVTISQTVYEKRALGENDYTDGKVVLSKNGENNVNFTHSDKEITINEKIYSYDMLLSGWKLTSVTKDGTEITTFVEPENYNYADKTNANKDIGTVYAENGWYVVPDGVTAITVEAVWGWAIYVKDPYNTMVYDKNYWFSSQESIASGRTGASESNFGTNNTDDVIASLKRAYEIIYLAGESGDQYDIYSHLVVLCGDLHDVRPSTTTVPSTTYADTDEEGNVVYDVNNYNTNLSTKKNACQEFWAGCNRLKINATITSDPSSNEKYKLYQKCISWGWSAYGGLRFDNIIYTLVNAVQGSSTTLSSSIIYYQGNNTDLKFVTTERFYTNNPNNSSANNNWSLTLYHQGKCDEIRILGGYMVISYMDHARTTDVDCSTMKYILIGGNARINNYSGGTRSEMNPTYQKTIYDLPTLCVTGGNISGISLTGATTVNKVAIQKNTGLYFYMTDGYCNGTIYGSGGTPLLNGNVYINIENATVKTVFGGGSKEAGNINGNAYINLKNMQIGLSATSAGGVYGGPQFGNIVGDTYLNLDNVTVYGNVYRLRLWNNINKYKICRWSNIIPYKK